MIFKFDLLNHGEQIKLGVDFKFKVKANGRMFQFWLNSESIRHRDLPRIYENEDFTIPEGASDEELYQLILPKDVLLEHPEEHRQSGFSSATRLSIAGGARHSIKGDREVIEKRLKDIEE